MRQSLAIAALALLAGCTSHQQQLADFTQGQAGSLLLSSSGALPVQGWVPAGHHERLQVFIEGDGYAWVTASRPSLDPTPREWTIFRIALAQGSAYLGRPCQYVSADACGPKVWTDQRFSPAALQAMAQALDGVKMRAGASTLELVGYSGGAAIALLLAARRDDVVAVQTIAGNLSPRAWARLQGYTGLDQSLDPTDFAERLSRIPQRHLIAAGDKVVPRASQDAYLARLALTAPVQVVQYQGDHWKGMSKAWSHWQGSSLQGREY